MKLKCLLKSFFILGLTIFPISFSSATFGEIQLDLDVGECSGNYCLDDNFNFVYNDGVNNYNFWVINMGGRNWNTADNLFGWYNNQFYFTTSNGYYTDGAYKKGISTQYCLADLDSYCESNFETITDDFYNLPFNGITIWNATDVALVNQGVCLRTDYKRYCFNNNNKTSTPIDGLWQGKSITNKNVFVGLFSSSPITKATQYYYSTGSCPSVGQLISSSNLTRAVCYAGYDGDLIYTAGENTTIQAGSGLNLFETYELFSGNMNIQDWYDTYWTYYNNISFNPYPFYNKPKALLGLMVARQTAGLTRGYNGSYTILNYCYYVLNNIPYSQSTCVGSNVSTQYPGITMTDQDKQDIVDAVNDNFIVHQPGSGSIFLDPSQGLGGGGSSWGDDQCDGIPCLFEKFYQMFTSSRVNDVDFSQGGQGILPGYIALAFVVVVLFYVFKR